MKSINLKLEQGLLKRIDQTIKQQSYATRTEFIREAIRNKLTEEEKQEAMRRITAMRGVFKGKLKKVDYEKVRNEVARKAAAKFGLEL